MESKEEYRIRAIRLSQDWWDFPTGTILLIVHDDDNNHWTIQGNRLSDEFSDEEIREIGEFVDHAEYLDYQKNLLESHKLAPEPPQLEAAFLEPTKQLETGEEPNISSKTEDNPETPQEASEELALKAQAKKTIGGLRNTALSYKRQAEEFKGLMELNGKILSQHGESQKKQIDLRSRELSAQMAKMKQQMEDMQDALQMLNLYLGTTEEVIIIADGPRASAETPITIRQRILFMDEEAMFLDHTGIDARTLNHFDRFLKETDLLDKIIPEEKGIIVMRVCREERKYCSKEVDPFTMSELNLANSQSYWIIRNGKSIWRFWSDITPNKKLFPAQGQEIADVSTHHPQTSQYQKDIKSAIGERKIYLKCGLLIQGIIDRTNVFAPFFPGERPQITNPASWEHKLVLREDDNDHLLRGTKEPLHIWWEQINHGLQAGQRILVQKTDPDDVHPKGAKGYNTKELLQVTEHSKGEFRASFERTDEVWDKRRENYRPARTRGSIKIDPRSKEWINYENVNVEDAKYYLNDREGRKDYLSTIPILIKILELKEEEALQEAPFRALLLTQLQAVEKIPNSAAEQLNQLVTWWKTKNKDYRPLCGNEQSDKIAYKEITEEFQKLQSAETTENFTIPENCVLALQKDPKIIYAYIPEEDEIPWFCTRQTWKNVRKKWVLKTEEPHKTIGKHERHHSVLHKDEEWIKLSKDVEKERLPLSVILEADYSSLNNIEDYLAIILQVETYKPFQQNIVGVSQSRFGSKNLYSESITIKNGIAVKAPHKRIGLDSNFCDSLTDKIPAIGAVTKGRHRRTIVLAFNEERIKTLQKKEKKERHARKRRERVRKYYQACVQELRKVCRQEWIENEKVQFVAEGGNIEFFEDHLRTVKANEIATDSLERALDILIDRCQMHPKTLEGKTWKEIKDLTEDAPKNKVKERHDFFHRGFPWFKQDQIAVYPEKFRMPPISTTTEED